MFVGRLILITEPGPNFGVAPMRINLDPGLRRDDHIDT